MVAIIVNAGLKNFTSAALYCTQRNQHLLMLKNHTILNTAENGNMFFWIGARFEDRWRWTTGEDASDFFQPASSGMCGGINLWSSGPTFITWNLAHVHSGRYRPCDEPNYFLCDRILTLSPSPPRPPSQSIVSPRLPELFASTPPSPPPILPSPHVHITRMSADVGSPTHGGFWIIGGSILSIAVCLHACLCALLCRHLCLRMRR